LIHSVGVNDIDSRIGGPDQKKQNYLKTQSQKLLWNQRLSFHPSGAVRAHDAARRSGQAPQGSQRDPLSLLLELLRGRRRRASPDQPPRRPFAAGQGVLSAPLPVPPARGTLGND
jgi:hypothetical protein